MKAIPLLSVMLSPLLADDALLSFEQKVVQSDGLAGDGFGEVLALSGDTMVVGAKGDDTAAGSNAGSVSVFTRNGGVWSLQTKLTAGDAASGDRYGAAVALSGDVLVVGSTHDDASGTVYNSGSVYVYTRSGNGWSQQAKLVASDPEQDDHFGNSVALSHDTILIGAEGKHGGAGAAYVFRNNAGSWSQQAKLVAPEPQAQDRFGCAVALEGDTALIGAESDDVSVVGANQGCAYVFTRVTGSWSQQAQLFADDASSDGFFGTSVALQGDAALIGATGASGYQGAAYLFQRDETNWVQTERFDAGDSGFAYDAFGCSLALAANRILVGATRSTGLSGEDQVLYDAGRSWLFLSDGGLWQAKSRFSAVDCAQYDEFGGAVALDGEDVLIGSAGEDGAMGGAHVFRIVINASQPERWRHRYFSFVENVGDAADDADPDQDGVVNLLERAFSLHPLKKRVGEFVSPELMGSMPVIQTLHEEGRPDRLRIEYLRHTTVLDHELTCMPQFSSNLEDGGEWGWMTPVVETVTPINAFWEKVTVEDTPPPGGTVRFGRVKVVTP